MKMKIGLICRGRTRSTAIIQSLSAKLHVSNYREIYRTIPEIMKKDYKLVRQQSIDLELSRFKTLVLETTEKCFSQDSFITKIWPSMFTYHLYYKMSTNETFDMIKNNTIFDITKYFRLNQYDKLYFIDRDLHTSASSWVYAHKHNLYHFSKKGITNPHKPTITLNEKDFNVVRFYVLEYCLQQKLKKYLLDNNIVFEDITDNSLELIDDSLARIRRTDSNYKSLIRNYDELHSLITNWYPICLENTKDWHYI